MRGEGKQAWRIERATRRDVADILRLIKALAKYERLSKQVVATRAALRQTLFGRRPAAEVILARVGRRAVGFALYFQNYSTFLAKPGIYLEDLYVEPRWRGHGIGEGLLRAVARTAVRRGAGRFEWAVLDWNTPAIGFYRRMGARPLHDWTVFRLAGDALEKFG